MGDNTPSVDSSTDLTNNSTVNKPLNMSAPINGHDIGELSENGENYHPKQDASNLVSKPDSGKGILVEPFIGTKDDADVEHIANLVVNELLQTVDSVDELGVIYTGMFSEFNHALQTVVNDRDLDITVEICYPDIGKYVEAHVTDYMTAWDELYNKRNRQLAREHVDLAVSAVAAPSPGGATFTQNMLRLGTQAMTVDLTDKVY